jgi:hypothetical protein
MTHLGRFSAREVAYALQALAEKIATEVNPETIGGYYGPTEGVEKDRHGSWPYIAVGGYVYKPDGREMPFVVRMAATPWSGLTCSVFTDTKKAEGVSDWGGGIRDPKEAVRKMGDDFVKVVRKAARFNY